MQSSASFFSRCVVNSFPSFLNLMIQAFFPSSKLIPAEIPCSEISGYISNIFCSSPTCVYPMFPPQIIQAFYYIHSINYECLVKNCYHQRNCDHHSRLRPSLRFLDGFHLPTVIKQVLDNDSNRLVSIR